jgi:hypothetical protein
MELCYDLATGRAKNAITFFELSKMGLNQLDDQALAMSWSVVDYLIKERLDQFRSLIQLLNKRPSFRMAFIEVFGDDSRRELLRKTKEDQHLDELYRLTTHDFELAWKAWVKNQNEYKDASDPRKRKPRQKREFPGDEEGKKEADKPKRGKEQRKRRSAAAGGDISPLGTLLSPGRLAPVALTRRLERAPPRAGTSLLAGLF